MNPPADAGELTSLLNADAGHEAIRQTHISIVYLTASSAYKRLKPVRFDFLDFSTREGRYTHLGNEARLNRRLAPGIYRGLIPLWKTGGRWRLVGSGPPDDWLLAMERLPDAGTLEAALADGRFDEASFGELVTTLVAFFERSSRNRAITANGDPAVIRANLLENFGVLEEAASAGLLDERLVDRLRSRQFQAIETLEAELRERQQGGWIRDGHGDLRAEHVYLTKPLRVVDCIAFNHRLRWIDVADDVAFLATDLIRLGAESWAERVGHAVQERMHDPISDDLAGFYRSYRFAVRAKVAMLRGREQVGDEQRETNRSGTRLMARAIDAIHAHHPWFVAVCGLSGTGKTTVAKALAERIGAARYSSDIVRKSLHGLAPTQRGSTESLYSEAANEATYDELLARAEQRLSEGTGVVLDATFLRRSDREAAQAVAGRAKIPVLFVECRCAESEIERRLQERATRGHDASDATLDVWRTQRSISDGYSGLLPADRLVVDTAGKLTSIVDEIVMRVKGR